MRSPEHPCNFLGACCIPYKHVLLQETCRARTFCRSTFKARAILTATFQAATFFTARCKANFFFRYSFGLKTCVRASCTRGTFCKENFRPGILFRESCKAAFFSRGVLSLALRPMVFTLKPYQFLFQALARDPIPKPLILHPRPSCHVRLQCFFSVSSRTLAPEVPHLEPQTLQ